MPICEHGHETNVFVTEGETHDCKTCGVCQYLSEKQPPEEINPLKGRDLADLLLTVTEFHSEETHGKNYREKCKKALREAMSDWVKANLSIGGKK